MFVVTSSLIEKLEEEPGLIDALAYSEHRSSTHYFVHTTDIHEQLSDSRDGSSSSVDNTLKIFANDQQNIMPDFEITGFLNTGDFLNQKEAPKDPTEQKKIERFSKGYNRIKNSIKALGFANKQILFTPGNHDCIRTPSKIDTQNFALY
ncbi:metallophosphoesterase, partial [Candidatus Pacearchaeota archaeon]|nr:metallophosphoesterase [Candidatus Pacearchaeota archaeon]